MKIGEFIFDGRVIVIAAQSFPFSIDEKAGPEHGNSKNEGPGGDKAIVKVAMIDKKSPHSIEEESA